MLQLERELAAVKKKLAGTPRKKRECFWAGINSGLAAASAVAAPADSRSLADPSDAKGDDGDTASAAIVLGGEGEDGFSPSDEKVDPNRKTEAPARYRE